MSAPDSRHDAVTQLYAHTTWRPDWRADRPHCWWYLTFEHDERLQEAAERLQQRLGHPQAAELIPPRWLHLTVQDVGFADELSHRELSRLEGIAAERLTDLEPLELDLGPVIPMLSAVALEAGPADALGALRSRLRDAIGVVRGYAGVPGPRYFRPHVSLAYLNRECSAGDLLGPLGDLRAPSLRVGVESVSLVEVTRGHCSYRWHTLAEIPLGQVPAAPPEGIRRERVRV
jgi:2'-5' RNA ligase